MYRVIDAVRGGLEDVGMFVESVLDLERIDVLTAANDEVTLPGRDEQDPVVEPAEVAGADPPPGPDRLRVGGVVVPIPEHRHPAARFDVALCARREHGTAVVRDAGLQRRRQRPPTVGPRPQPSAGCPAY